MAFNLRTFTKPVPSTTTQAKGMAVNDDDHLEREADAWGDRAARGEQVGRSGEDRADGEPGEVRHVYRDHDRDGARERKRRDAPCESLSIERARPRRRGLATDGGRPCGKRVVPKDHRSQSQAR